MDNFKRDNINIECRKSAIVSADVICDMTRDKTFAGKETIGISFLFYDDKLYRIHVVLSEKDFEDVVQALQEKYGKSKKETEIVSNRMGAKFNNVTYSWQRKKADLRATRYSGNLAYSSVSFSHEDYFKEYEKRKAEKSKKGSKDL